MRWFKTMKKSTHSVLKLKKIDLFEHSVKYYFVFNLKLKTGLKKFWVMKHFPFGGTP